MKFKIVDNQNTYRWQLFTNDGRFLARSRKYKTFQACKNDVHYVALSAVSISLDRFFSNDDSSLSDIISSAIPTSLPEGVFD